MNIKVVFVIFFLFIVTALSAPRNLRTRQKSKEEENSEEPCQLLADVECDSPVEHGEEYPECNYLLNTHERCKPRSRDFVDVQHSLDHNAVKMKTNSNGYKVVLAADT